MDQESIDRFYELSLNIQKRAEELIVDEQNRGMATLFSSLAMVISVVAGLCVTRDPFEGHGEAGMH